MKTSFRGRILPSLPAALVGVAGRARGAEPSPPGNPGLEFEVYQNEEIKKVKLSSYRGKWLVLLFYPADFTFVCPTELEEAAEYYGEQKRRRGDPQRQHGHRIRAQGVA